MVLAAGLGTRMRPLTLDTPKPLLKVCNKTLLDHALDTLAGAGVAKSVVNVHYLADQIEAHLGSRKVPEIIISDERETLLDSGGGTKKALEFLKPSKFFLLNADSFWIDNQANNLLAMANIWNSDEMDILLLLTNHEQAVGFDGRGDFFMDKDGRLERRGEKPAAPFIYAGAGIYAPQIFDRTPNGAFSLNLLFDDAISKGRLHGILLDGLWLHVGTPKAILLAEQAIAESVV